MLVMIRWFIRLGWVRVSVMVVLLFIEWFRRLILLNLVLIILVRLFVRFR